MSDRSFSSKQTDLKHRADIDGLRALAIIAVIVNHYSKNILPGGYLGVDIFFVISGYVITSALTNREHLTFTDFMLGFYQRRIQRLLPGLLLCVLITALVGFFFIPSEAPSFVLSWRTGIAALFGLSNLYLLRQATDYFGSSAELNLFTHTWSLGVEEQFYVLFPLLVWLAGFSRQIPGGGRAKKLFYSIGLLSIASVILFVYLSNKNSPSSYFLVTSRFWELGAGCLVFLMLHRQVLTNKLSLFRADFLVAALVAALFIPLAYQVEATVLVVLLTALLMASLRPALPVYTLLTLKPIVFVGVISYSLYLWHWSVLVISRWTIGIHWWSFPIQLGVTFLLAYASYRYIESPLRYSAWSGTKFKTIAKGFAAALGCSVLLVGLGMPLKDALYLGSDAIILSAQNTENKKPSLPSSTTEFSQTHKNIAMEIENCNMTPHHQAGKMYRPKPIVDQKFIRNCISALQPKVILIGDSFAQILSTHTALAAKEVGYEFKLLYGFNCPYPLDINNTAKVSKTDCEIDPPALKSELIKNINPGDVVVLRSYYPKPLYIKISGFSMENWEVSAYDREIESLYHAIFARGGSLLLIGSNPSIEANPACSDPQWFNAPQRTACTEDLSRSSLLTNYAVRHDQHLLDQYAGKYPRFEVISPTKFLCKNDTDACPFELEGRNLYRSDNVHISNTAIDMIYPAMMSSLHRLTGN